MTRFSCKLSATSAISARGRRKLLIKSRIETSSIGKPYNNADLTGLTHTTNMKKTLITLAALAMASVASAATPTDGKLTVTGDITNGVWLPNGDTTIEANGDYSINSVKGYSDGSTTANYTKTGTGTLTVKGDSDGYGGKQPVTDVTVAAGTLKIAYDGAIGKGNVSVSSGATLELANATTYGNSNADAPRTLTLTGGATISGAGSLALQGGVISATGTGNVVSVDLKRNWNANIDVATGGELTFSGDLLDDNGSAKFVKTGDGKLIVDNTTINSAFTMQLDGGTLDLSDVTSMGALTAANDTTIILGQEIAMSGALTLGEGVTIDVSSWASITELNDIFSGVTSFSGASPVTVIFSDATKSMTLSAVDGVVTVPEPATATLSLLALAGLAARRRRK